LENHFWIKDNFIDKLGRMAPNLVNLSFKGINMSNQAFMDCVMRMPKLEHIDVSNCRTIEPNGMKTLFGTAKCIFTLKAISCKRGITDEIMPFLAKHKKMTVLDLSYCSELTDEGLKVFNPPPPNNDIPADDQEKKEAPPPPPIPVYKFRELSLAGLTNATNEGFKAILETCEKTLLVLNLSLNDQESFTSEVSKAIAQCFELLSLDLTGCLGLDDQALNHLTRGFIPPAD